jgi:hypothetical protein
MRKPPDDYTESFTDLEKDMVDELSAILDKPKGFSLVYHTGAIGFDRKWMPCKQVAAVAWDLYLEGAIALVQKRVGWIDQTNDVRKYDYIAQRR